MTIFCNEIDKIPVLTSGTKLYFLTIKSHNLFCLQLKKQSLMLEAEAITAWFIYQAYFKLDPSLSVYSVSYISIHNKIDFIPLSFNGLFTCQKTSAVGQWVQLNFKNVVILYQIINYRSIKTTKRKIGFNNCLSYDWGVVVLKLDFLCSVHKCNCKMLFKL